MSSSIVTLFSEQKIAQAGSPSMLASVFAHLAASGIFFVLMKVAVPHIIHVSPQDFSVVRILNYNPSTSQASSGDDGLHYLARNTPAIKSAGGRLRPRRRVLPPNPKVKAGPQTILQAHPNHVAPPQHSVIPTVLLTASHPKITEKLFTPPPRPNAAAPTPHLLTLPNEEIHVADLMISSAPFTSNDFPVLPSTTVPYKLDNPTTDAQIVETTSPTQHAPSATQLLSISDLQIVKGDITIPQTEDEVQKTAATGSMTAGEEYKTPGVQSSPQPGTSESPASGTDAGTNGEIASASRADSSNPTKAAPGITIQGQGSLSETNGLSTAAGPQPGTSMSGSVMGNQISFTKIVKSKKGQFGAVLMGDSPEQNFPETADLWAGRNAYTVYINVGTQTNWILQYSLPKSAPAAERQEVLGAPYPYEMLRPNFAPSELNSDALLVHGYITTAGRLIDPTAEYPPGFTLAAKVLHALMQWQFRPAMLNGAPTMVEVLFIIPNHPN